MTLLLYKINGPVIFLTYSTKGGSKNKTSKAKGDPNSDSDDKFLQVSLLSVFGGRLFFAGP